jgi:RNA polymerase sigma factor (TIGR02999 family)
MGDFVKCRRKQALVSTNVKQARRDDDVPRGERAASLWGRSKQPPGGRVGDVTELLERARGGDAAAWDAVVALIYDDLRRVARGVLRGAGSATFDATGLVHECYLRLSRAGAEGVLDRQHFMALAARAMRQLMLNHARDRLAAKRGGGAPHVTLGDDDAVADAQAEQLLLLDQALAKLAAEDERLAKVVECRVFAGLDEASTAAALDLPLRTMQRLYADARARLGELLAG